MNIIYYYFLYCYLLIKIPQEVIQSLGIHENEEIYVYPITQKSEIPAPAKQVFLEPITMDDWYEDYYIESTLLFIHYLFIFSLEL